MASLNRVTLIGNLGKDPELRYTAGGQPVATINLATSERFKNRAGEWQEHTEWHRVVLFDRLAEIADEFLTQGKTVYIEGRLHTSKLQDNSGRYTTEIIGEKMQMFNLGKGKKDNDLPTAGIEG